MTVIKTPFSKTTCARESQYTAAGSATESVNFIGQVKIQHSQEQHTINVYQFAVPKKRNIFFPNVDIMCLLLCICVRYLSNRLMLRFN